MTKSKRIAMAKALEHAVNFKLANEGPKMTREEIDTQINMEKMHNARTKRAIKNIKESDRSLKSFGGMYTQAELNMLHDLHPGLESIHKEVMESEVLSQDEILEVLEQLNMYARLTQEELY